MKNVIILTFIILLFNACDFVYYARIQNELNESIEVTVKYNKRKYDSVFNGVNYYKMVPDFEDNHDLKLIKYDSVLLQITYEVPPNGVMQIEHSVTGWNGYPDFYYIDEIRIHNKLMEQSILKNDFRKAFKKIKNYEFVLTIGK